MTDVALVMAAIMCSPTNGGIGIGGIMGVTDLSRWRVSSALDELEQEGKIERWPEAGHARNGWRATIAAIAQHRSAT